MGGWDVGLGPSIKIIYVFLFHQPPTSCTLSPLLGVSGDVQSVWDRASHHRGTRNYSRDTSVGTEEEQPLHRILRSRFLETKGDDRENGPVERTGCKENGRDPQCPDSGPMSPRDQKTGGVENSVSRQPTRRTPTVGRAPSVIGEIRYPENCFRGALPFGHGGMSGRKKPEVYVVPKHGPLPTGQTGPVILFDNRGIPVSRVDSDGLLCLTNDRVRTPRPRRP